MQKRILQFYFYKRYFSTDLALPSTIKFKICFRVTEKLDLQNSLKFKKNIQVIYIYKIKKKTNNNFPHSPNKKETLNLPSNRGS